MKGQHRYGTGVLYRLPGPVPIGVMLGRWTDRPLALRQQIAAERSRQDHGLRLIRPDEEDNVFEHLSVWYPHLWNRRWWEHLAYRLDLAYVDGFGNFRRKRPRWSYTKWTWLMSSPVVSAVATGDPATIDAALPKATVAPDPGWDDEVRAVAVEMQRQREEAKQAAAYKKSFEREQMTTEQQRMRRGMGE